MKTPEKLKQQTIDIINSRIGDEYTAHYFYKSAANFSNNFGFFNAGKFFDSESKSELDHANGLMDYMVKWNCKPTIPSTPANFKFEGLVDCIEKAYDLEYNLLNKYNESSRKLLVQDLTTFDFLQGYRKIQDDAVAEYSDLLNVLSLIDATDKFQLFVFEKENFGK
jgi:ferritin